MAAKNYFSNFCANDWQRKIKKKAVPRAKALRGPVAQLARAPALQAGGQGFKSPQVHQSLFTAEFASLGALRLASAGISAR